MEESATLFLGDLSVFCTEKDIRKLFRSFGSIDAIRVKRGSSSKTNLSYGFIRFADRQSAENAFHQLNGVMFLGRALRIGWAEGKGGMKTLSPDLCAPKRGETAQIHVSFISKQIDMLISEATLRSLFGIYGEVVDVALKKSQFDKNLRVQNGYGFVHYAFTPDGVRSALTAVQCLHQVTIDRVTYDCSISHGLQQYLLHAKDPTLVPFRTTHPALPNYNNSTHPLSGGQTMDRFQRPYSTPPHIEMTMDAVAHNGRGMLPHPEYSNQGEFFGQYPRGVNNREAFNDPRHYQYHSASPSPAHAQLRGRAGLGVSQAPEAYGFHDPQISSIDRPVTHGGRSPRSLSSYASSNSVHMGGIQTGPSFASHSGAADSWYSQDDHLSRVASYPSAQSISSASHSSEGTYPIHSSTGLGNGSGGFVRVPSFQSYSSSTVEQLPMHDALTRSLQRLGSQDNGASLYRNGPQAFPSEPVPVDDNMADLGLPNPMDRFSSSLQFSPFGSLNDAGFNGSSMPRDFIDPIISDPSTELDVLSSVFEASSLQSAFNRGPF
eukprot:gene455-492_t